MQGPWLLALSLGSPLVCVSPGSPAPPRAPQCWGRPHAGQEARLPVTRPCLHPGVCSQGNAPLAKVWWLLPSPVLGSKPRPRSVPASVAPSHQNPAPPALTFRFVSLNLHLPLDAPRFPGSGLLRPLGLSSELLTFGGLPSVSTIQGTDSGLFMGPRHRGGMYLCSAARL